MVQVLVTERIVLYPVKEMTMKHHHKYSILIKIPVLLLILLLSVMASAQEKDHSDPTAEKPVKGISIMLPIYSGRPNPVWWITEGPEFKSVIEHIRSMKPVENEIFDYDEWNKPGYASFWIVPYELKDLPSSIHIWRDMALITMGGEKARLYAKEATELYDLLVKQAEEKGYRKYFLNYHRQKENQE